ncbi:hypothetical protein LEP1GSC050_3793 [Leptospira broomii serovar Hurstbridge str. 5399]|uniref:Uncharacterized protein n=1 Tax=Leptospira broomii serovar Hurstbridge str. 5399 TaxID=1049789 RepID=T0FA80_9LEPT|nr:hypothetical protein LEP1GSC050_3793 [Leptospira broomii serovar Hurstbridge str. 5399]
MIKFPALPGRGPDRWYPRRACDFAIIMDLEKFQVFLQA